MTDVGRVAGRLCRYWFIRLPRTVCRTLMTSNSKWIVQVPKLISIIDADTLQEKIRARKTRRRSKQVLSQEPKMSVKGFVNVLEASWWVSKVQVSLTHLAFWQTPRTDITSLLQMFALCISVPVANSQLTTHWSSRLQDSLISGALFPRSSCIQL